MSANDWWIFASGFLLGAVVCFVVLAALACWGKYGTCPDLRSKGKIVLNPDYDREVACYDLDQMKER
jgi:hypothetical protein